MLIKTNNYVPIIVSCQHSIFNILLFRVLRKFYTVVSLFIPKEKKVLFLLLSIYTWRQFVYSLHYAIFKKIQYVNFAGTQWPRAVFV